MILFDLRNLWQMIDIFFAAITVPSLLVSLCTHKRERLITVWASSFRLIVKRAVHADFNERAVSLVIRHAFLS